MATIEEIAAKAGVSRHTVARILKGQLKETWPGKAAQAVRIRQIAAEMGYRPNASARALVLGKFGCVGVLMSTDMARSRMTPELIEEIEGVLAKRNIHMTLARFSDEKLVDEKFVPGILREWMCDGLIINCRTAVPERMKKIISDNNVPSVWLNTRSETDSVYTDDYGGGMEAVRRLIDAGHQRIAYFDYSFGTDRDRGDMLTSKLDRYAGYSKAMEDAGLNPLFIHDEPGAAGRGFLKNVEEAFQSQKRPTAAIAFSQYEMFFVREILARLGLSVPGDVSTIVFEQGWRPPAELRDDAALSCSDRDMAEAAVEMLVKKIENPARVIVSRVISFTYRNGNTILVVDTGKKKVGR